eukprot:ctg_1623.g524
MMKRLFAEHQVEGVVGEAQALGVLHGVPLQKAQPLGVRQARAIDIAGGGHGTVSFQEERVTAKAQIAHGEPRRARVGQQDDPRSRQHVRVPLLIDAIGLQERRQPRPRLQRRRNALHVRRVLPHGDNHEPHTSPTANTSSSGQGELLRSLGMTKRSARPKNGASTYIWCGGRGECGRAAATGAARSAFHDERTAEPERDLTRSRNRHFGCAIFWRERVVLFSFYASVPAAPFRLALHGVFVMKRHALDHDVEPARGAGFPGGGNMDAAPHAPHSASAAPARHPRPAARSGSSAGHRTVDGDFALRVVPGGARSVFRPRSLRVADATADTLPAAAHAARGEFATTATQHGGIACPGGDLCSGNGICVGGRCACFAGWHGRACDVFRGSNDTAPSCARNPQTGVACSGGLQGVCKHNGTCACRDGWGGVACDHATAPSVYALAAQGAGTLERCPMSPPPRPSQRAVPVLPAPEPGRQWLSLSGTVLQPNASDHSIGAALPWLCIAMDAAARLGLASVAAPDLVLQQWIQLPPAAANAWYMAAAVSAPVTVNLSDALTAYMTQTLPYKLGDSVRVVNVSAGHVLPVNNSSSAEWEAVLSPHTSDDSSSNSLSALEIAGIVAIGVLALLLLIAIGVGILWRLRGRRKTTDEDSCADESPTLARNSPSAPSPHWMTAAEGVPFGGMNLEELVTVPMATPPHRTHQA